MPYSTRRSLHGRMHAAEWACVAVDQRFETAPELHKPSQQRCPDRLANGFLKALLILKKTINQERCHFWWLSQRGKVIPKCKFHRGQIPLVENTCREIELPGLALNIWAWFLTEQGLEPGLEH